MKLSVSLPSEDVEFLDGYARSRGLSRSAALRRAIEMLRAAELARQYAQAWGAWAEAGDAEAWEGIVTDGLG